MSDLALPDLHPYRRRLGDTPRRAASGRGPRVRLAQDAPAAAVIAALREPLRRGPVAAATLERLVAALAPLVPLAPLAPLAPLDGGDGHLAPAVGALVAGRAVAHGDPGDRAAMLAAVIRALSGARVHLVCPDEARARAIAAGMAPLAELARLTVAAIAGADTPPRRAEAYGADITVLAMRELACDTLRDAVALRQRHATPAMERRLAGLFPVARAPLVLRGFDTAIVVEADRILLDEATAPVVITEGEGSADPMRAPETMANALAFADTLGSDPAVVALDAATAAARLTPAGRARLGQVCAALDGPEHSPWAEVDTAVALVEEAMVVLHLLERGIDYTMEGGRAAPAGRDPAWGPVRRQMVELKEGGEGTAAARPVAGLTVPGLFARYARLGAIAPDWTGARRDLRRLYGLRLARLAGVGQRPPPRARLIEGDTLRDRIERLAAGAEGAVAVLVEGPAVAARLVPSEDEAGALPEGLRLMRASAAQEAPERLAQARRVVAL
ncbi:MAG: hypothetical protein AAFR52_06110, partial [Pseudomonadota bacterium]